MCDNFEILPEHILKYFSMVSLDVDRGALRILPEEPSEYLQKSPLDTTSGSLWIFSEGLFGCFTMSLLDGSRKAL